MSMFMLVKVFFIGKLKKIFQAEPFYINFIEFCEMIFLA